MTSSPQPNAFTYPEVVAFAEGYYDGRLKGAMDNSYEDDLLRARYNDGYWRGVSDFSQYDESQYDEDTDSSDT